MGRVKRHNECGLVVGQLGFHNTAPPRGGGARAAGG